MRQADLLEHRVTQRLRLPSGADDKQYCNNAGPSRQDSLPVIVVSIARRELYRKLLRAPSLNRYRPWPERAASNHSSGRGTAPPYRKPIEQSESNGCDQDARLAKVYLA